MLLSHPELMIPSLLSGLIIGLFLAMFGGGGSVLAVPLLIYCVGITDPHMAIGTSAAAVAVIAMFNLMGHWKTGTIKWPCATLFGTFGIIGSLGGSTLAKQIDGSILLIGFSMVMAAIGLSMLRIPKSNGADTARLNRKLALRIIPLALIIGFAAGFFGIGGGFLIVPGLMLATHMPLHNAVGSSLFSVVLFGAATSANYAFSGWVNFPIVGFVLLGGILGGVIGLKFSKLLKSHILLGRRLFATMIIGVAGYVGYGAI